MPAGQAGASAELPLAELKFKDEQIAELARQNEDLSRTAEELRQQLALLQRRLYGPRSEKYHPDQLYLDSVLQTSAEPPAVEPEPTVAVPAGTRDPSLPCPCLLSTGRHPWFFRISRRRTGSASGPPPVSGTVEGPCRTGRRAGQEPEHKTCREDHHDMSQSLRTVRSFPSLAKACMSLSRLSQRQTSRPYTRTRSLRRTT